MNPGRIVPTRCVALAVLIVLTGCRDVTEPATGAVPALAGVTSAPTFYQVSSGNSNTCGVTTDNRLFCWGHSGYVFPGYMESTVPIEVGAPDQVRQVSAGYGHACLITVANRLYCWGYNPNGQVGDGTRTPRGSPVRVGGTRLFRQVEAGGITGAAGSHTCAIEAGTGNAYCWGDNTRGQLGDGTKTTRLAPVAVAGNRRFRQLAVGAGFTCGITTAGKAFCWGSDSFGQLGNGSGVTQRVKPAAVAGTRVFRQISAMWDHVCAVTNTSRAFCWGANQFGQLGDGTLLNRFTPRAVSGDVRFTRVSTGAAHTCGESSGNKGYCWGCNAVGQLGDGTPTPRRKPTAVAGGRVLEQLSAGSSHTCAVAHGATAYCWGWNEYGQAGNGTTEDRFAPVSVGGP